MCALHSRRPEFDGTSLHSASSPKASPFRAMPVMGDAGAAAHPKVAWCTLPSAESSCGYGASPLPRMLQLQATLLQLAPASAPSKTL